MISRLTRPAPTKQLSVVAIGLDNALSSVFSVSPAAADHLAIQNATGFRSHGRSGFFASTADSD